MNIDQEIIKKLSIKNGFTHSSPTLYDVRTWLWTHHRVFVNVESIELGDHIKFAYNIEDKELMESQKGSPKWYEIDDALIEGLYTVLISM